MKRTRVMADALVLLSLLSACTAARSSTSFNAATAAMLAGDLPSARRFYLLALEEYDRAPANRSMLGTTHRKLASVLIAQGETEDALRHLQLAADQFERVRPPSDLELGKTWEMLGLLQRQMDAVEAAILSLEKSVEHYRAGSFPKELPAAHLALANAYLSGGNLKEARRHFALASEAYRRVGLSDRAAIVDGQIEALNGGSP